MLRRLLSVVEHNATQPQIVNLFSVLSAEAGDRSHPAHDYFSERYVRLRAELELSADAAGRRRRAGARERPTSAGRGDHRA